MINDDATSQPDPIPAEEPIGEPITASVSSWPGACGLIYCAAAASIGKPIAWPQAAELMKRP